MAIWGIADIHASRTDPATGRASKPMDLFGDRWHDHVARIEAAWRERVDADDTVIVAGDIDWAMHLEEARETLERLASWPGHKILIRGNHDYWWSSKATSRVRVALPSGIEALHNNALPAEGFNICGTKGSPVPGGIEWSAQDAKLLNRERERLALSLAARDPSLPTIVALHYPPFYVANEATPFTALLTECGAAACVYGHLHGDAARFAVQGRYGRVVYRLIAADAIGFAPVLLARDGEIIDPGEGRLAGTREPKPMGGGCGQAGGEPR